MNKIAIYGGAFDPLTVGHQICAQVVRACTGCIVWFMPAGVHRFGKEMASPEVRYEMCGKVAMHLGKGFFASNYDITGDFGGSTYKMMDSLTSEDHNEGIEFSIVIGLDNVDSVFKWDRGQELIERFPFIVVGRDLGFQAKRMPDWYLKDPHQYIDSNFFCSSTHVKKLLKEEKDASRYLSPPVVEIIQKHGLYQ